MTTVRNTKDLASLFRAGPYAWPGGYPMYAVTSDGAVLCWDCLKSEYSLIQDSVRDNCEDGWKVEGADINWEEADLSCDHCREYIESAY